ncbi:MAG: F0F1 ATP synthase subunit A, partial [Thermomicrobiales bacterium]
MKIHISVKPEVLWQLGPIAVTNSMFTMFIVMALLLLVFGLIAKNAKPVPGRAQGVFELITEFLLDLVEGTGGRELGRRVFPLIGGIFIFIAFSNYLGILPGVGTIYIKGGTEAGVEAKPEGAALELASISQDSVTPVTKAAGEEAAAEGHEEEQMPLFRPPNADINMT